MPSKSITTFINFIKSNVCSPVFATAEVCDALVVGGALGAACAVGKVKEFNDGNADTAVCMAPVTASAMPFGNCGK
jgi:hypothetical protein